jgi:hypothetical protein
MSPSSGKLQYVKLPMAFAHLQQVLQKREAKLPGGFAHPALGVLASLEFIGQNTNAAYAYVRYQCLLIASQVHRSGAEIKICGRYVFTA